MLKEFYTKVVPEVKAGRGSYIVTVLDGEYMGEKSLWHRDELLAVNRENSEAFWQSLDFGSTDNCRYGKANKEGEEIGVFIETLLPPCEMVICGGGHISLPLAAIGHMLGFEISVIDDRIFFANAQRFPKANVFCQDFSEALKDMGGENTYFVIVTRGHQYDQDCLRQILPKKSAYVGMIGSRHRVGLVKKTLLGEGFSQEKLDSLYSPIGLKIGAQSPEEVAVSILAELIQVRAEKNKGAASALGFWQSLAEPSELPQALVTIVQRRGSAPRQIGTKMIVSADGGCIGTIGGGCVEAEARQKGISIAKDGGSVLMTLDMTGVNAQDEGMVCGGIVTVLVEALS